MFSRYVCVAVDVQGYSRTPDPQQLDIQHELTRLLQEAATAAGLSRSDWKIQPQGDGELALIPGGGDEPVVIDRYIRGLGSLLEARNASSPGSAPLRIRVAVDCGRVNPSGANGFVGTPVVTVSRLIDSRMARAALDADLNAHLAVIVSDQVHKDLIRTGHTLVTPAWIRKVRILAKDFEEDAWIWVPGLDANRLSLPNAARAGGVRPGRAVVGALSVFTAGLLIVAGLLAHQYGGHGPQGGRGGSNTSDLSSSTSAETVPRSPRPSGGISGSGHRSVLPINSGDTINVTDHRSGDELLPGADVILHPRHAVNDEFNLTAWGLGRLARADSSAATRSGCAQTLAERTDTSLIVTLHGEADGGNLGVGGWFCVGHGSTPVAAVHILRLRTGLPGGLDLAITSWPG